MGLEVCGKDPLRRPTLDDAHRSPLIAELDWAPHAYKVLKSVHPHTDMSPAAQLVIEVTPHHSLNHKTYLNSQLPRIPP